MLKRTIIIASALAALAGPALASDDGYREREGRHEQSSETSRCAVQPGATWLEPGQVNEKLKQAGYTVRKLKKSHGCYEVKAIDAKGTRVEFYVDPTTGKMAGREGRS